MKKLIPIILVFLSGFACLVYQLLWMRQLGLLFGNTAHAAAMTLAVFFAGLAAGSWVWGRKSRTVKNPFLAYAGLEAAIAVTALLYFAVLQIFYSIYPAVYRSVSSETLLLSVKCLLAVLLVFPPAFCMGGTIPMMGQALIRNRDEFGVKAAWLYAINTLGAALGALATGFVFIRFMGFTRTCLTAIGITALVSVIASRQKTVGGEQGAWGGEQGAGVRGQKTDDRGLVVYAVCFLSGFGFLALEVVWTRLFSQIHTNSIYSFSAVLVIVLISLAVGAACAAGLARLRLQPKRTLTFLMLLGGISVMLSPHVFMSVTNGFQMLQTGGTLADYMHGLFGKGLAIVGVPAFVLGMVFPYLMKAEEERCKDAGAALGRLSAINTVGAILGSLLAGFLFLEHLGMWRTMQIIGALYLASVVLMPIGFAKSSIVLRSSGAVLLIILFTWLSPVEFRVTGWDPARPSSRILELWETSDCTVSVLMSEYDGCVITVNSNYRLGSTGAAWRQHFQGRIPLLVYPDTKSVFFLGVGTGISAGAALDPQFENVERVVACDMVPEVLEAAEKYMTGAYGDPAAGKIDFTSGLFEDDRVEFVVDDGRHYLMACEETFDMVNADLFLPYRSGAGSLYSLEHFQNVKSKLNPGGVFVQWLPLYQLTDQEFGTIARTMLETFDQVTVWRNNFHPGQETVALMGHRDEASIPQCAVSGVESRKDDVRGIDPDNIQNLEVSYDEDNVLLFYCGNLSKAEYLFDDYPLNTDDRPVIEYSAPLSMRRKVNGNIPTLVGPRCEELVSSLLAACPPESDPALLNRSPAQKRLVSAGMELQRFWLNKAMGDIRRARNAWARFVREWTNQDN